MSDLAAYEARATDAERRLSAIEARLMMGGGGGALRARGALSKWANF